MDKSQDIQPQILEKISPSLKSQVKTVPLQELSKQNQQISNSSLFPKIKKNFVNQGNSSLNNLSPVQKLEPQRKFKPCNCEKR